ncbi:MAG: hypothetical protein ACK5JO_02425, partial [Halodesulfovibrio sp.]
LHEKLESIFSALRSRGIERSAVIQATRTLLLARRNDHPGSDAAILACSPQEEDDSPISLTA